MEKDATITNIRTQGITHPLNGGDVMSIFLPLSAAAKTNLDLSDSKSSGSAHVKL